MNFVHLVVECDAKDVRYKCGVRVPRRKSSFTGFASAVTCPVCRNAMSR